MDLRLKNIGSGSIQHLFQDIFGDCCKYPSSTQIKTAYLHEVKKSEAFWGEQEAKLSLEQQQGLPDCLSMSHLQGCRSWRSVISHDREGPQFVQLGFVLLLPLFVSQARLINLFCQVSKDFVHFSVIHNLKEKYRSHFQSIAESSQSSLPRGGGGE